MGENYLKRTPGHSPRTQEFIIQRESINEAKRLSADGELGCQGHCPGEEDGLLNAEKKPIKDEEAGAMSHPAGEDADGYGHGHGMLGGQYVTPDDLRHSLEASHQGNRHESFADPPFLQSERNDTWFTHFWEWALGAKPIKDDGTGNYLAKHCQLFSVPRHVIHCHLFVFRFILVMTSMYLALFCIQLAPFIFNGQRANAESLMMTLLCVVPIVVVNVFYLPTLMNRSVLCTSIEAFKNPRVIQAVLRQEKVERALRILRLLVTIRYEEGVKIPAATDAQLHAVEQQLDESVELYEMGRIFDLFDGANGQPKDGTIMIDDVRHMLEKFGLGSHDKDGNSLEGWDQKMEDLSRTMDIRKDGIVTKCEFLTWMLGAEERAMEMEDEAFADHIFDMFDDDQTGTIHVSEFYHNLEKLGDGFSLDDVAQLVMELDKNEDNEFDKEELLDWIRKHREETEMHVGAVEFDDHGCVVIRESQADENLLEDYHSHTTWTAIVRQMLGWDDQHAHGHSHGRPKETAPKKACCKHTEKNKGKHD